MPALFATCNKCLYRFCFDYDFRQVRCQKCSTPFDWKSNPTQTGSPRGSFDGSGAAPTRGDSEYQRPRSAPKLPGEPGYEEYAHGAQEDHARSHELGESLKTEE